MSKNCELIRYSDFMVRNKKFFYVKDIKYTLKFYNIDTSGKKNNLLDKLREFYNKLKEYELHNDKMILIQKIFRGYITRKNLKLRGTGYFNNYLCKNEEDFFSMEKISNIPKVYLFTYVDSNNNIWGFDARSFRKLILTNKQNPYTRESINDNILLHFNELIKHIKSLKYPIYYESELLDPNQLFNDRVLTIFQKIDTLNVAAGGTDPDWFKNLDLVQLKSFYKHLEDIWNYRAELSNADKMKIVPDNNIFRINMNFITNLKNKQQLQNIILEEIDKLISSSLDVNSKSMGAYYVLIALCEVSSTCANCMPWLVMN